MIIAEILIAMIIGICAGIVTGLVPGVHINLVSVLLVSASGWLLNFTSPVVLGSFIIAMGITHTFLDTIPSIFLGAPDTDTALAVLPGHRLLLRGMGFEAIKLATIGSLLCLVATVALIPIFLPLVPSVFSYLEPYIGWILIAVVVFMILKEKGAKGILWGSFVFLISGVLGCIVFGIPNLEQPLFPMLSGLFGISLLLFSLSENTVIPVQRITEMIKVSKFNLFRTIGAGTFSGSLTALFPGLGPAQAAIIGSQIVGNIGMYSFIVLVGGINTVNFIFSLVTVYTIDKARNGAIVALMEILKSIDFNSLMVFICVVLITGGIATFLTMGIARMFSKTMNKVNYPLLCIGVILFITTLVFYFTSWLGLLVLAVSTAIGMLPSLVGVKKSNAMGCLLLPVIFYFLL